MSKDSPLPPLKVEPLAEQTPRDDPEPFISSSLYNPNTPIAIDFGSFHVRAGYTDRSLPYFNFPTKLTRYRDRKLAKTMTFIGNDTYLDQAVFSQARTPFDGSLITNWDMVGDILEYTFNHLGVVPDRGIPNPLIINERLGCLQSQRSTWYQLLFETFGLEKVTFGIDSLFAYYANNSPISDGLVINCGNEETNVIPIVGGTAALTEAKRINWGGRHAADFLGSLLSLKYPYFPTKLTSYQYRKMYEDYCYVSRDFDTDITKYLTLENLEEKDIIVESSFTEVLHPEKTEEELRIQAEKRKESGKRLQEQAKQKRMERVLQKTEEFEYFSRLRDQLVDQPKKTVLATLQNAGFDDERDFKKYMYNLEKSLKRAQSLDLDGSPVNGHDSDMNDEHKFDLLDVPDVELTEEQLKEKRKQKLMKANQEARKKAREEKEKLEREAEEARKREMQWRLTDLDGWIKDKRSKLAELIKRRKDKIKMREEMKDRKSQISQNRMKNLASLAEDSPRPGSKRTRQQATIDNDPNDTFGANDDDWLIYNDVVQNPEALDELIEEDYKDIVELEGQLLEYDPNFTEEDTLDAQYDWRNSVLHLFLRGPRPYDGENPHEQHQMHLNVERIRVPEILFEPNIGGCDQAGITELCESILLRKFGSKPSLLSDVCLNMASNTWITGGNAVVPGLRERIVKEFTEFLPSGTPISVKKSDNPSLDSWKGMAKLANNSEEFKNSFITRKEYEEYGTEYLKEHKLGNVSYFEIS